MDNQFQNRMNYYNNFGQDYKNDDDNYFAHKYNNYLSNNINRNNNFPVSQINLRKDYKSYEYNINRNNNFSPNYNNQIYNNQISNYNGIIQNNIYINNFGRNKNNNNISSTNNPNYNLNRKENKYNNNLQRINDNKYGINYQHQNHNIPKKTNYDNNNFNYNQKNVNNYFNYNENNQANNYNNNNQINYNNKININNQHKKYDTPNNIHYNKDNNNNQPKIYLNYFSNPQKTAEKNINTNDIILKNINEENDKIIFNKDLLKIFINIFYYEKLLNEKKEKIFNNDEKYYLIKPQWILDYKKYYNYENLNNLLLKRNISNLDECLNDIENNYDLYKDTLDFEKKELSDDLSNYKKINCGVRTKYDIKFITEGLIFSSKIIELIKKIYKDKLKFLLPKTLFFKNSNIFYINKLKIIIGNLYNKNLFIPKYILIYNSYEILNNEKKILLSDSFSINGYIKFSIPIENDNNYKLLKNEKNEELGKLIIIIIKKDQKAPKEYKQK